MFEMKKNIKVHFVGIGGIGMSGIAEILLVLGYRVSGSDVAAGKTIDRLRSMGAEVFIGHDRSNIKDVTVIVYSSAIDSTNPEICFAREENIPLMRRAEMLAELMRLKHGLAIAGTHGKTTTTSFLSTILQESGHDPTYVIGGIVSNLGGHAKVGKGEILVAEADESDGTFLLLNPIMSAITNIDLDHMNYYQTEEHLVSAFREFANKVPFYGCCALNAHDPRLMEIKREMKKPWCTFGIEGVLEEVDFLAKNIKYGAHSTEYDLYYKDKLASKIRLALPGRHNVLNSLGAISLAHHMNLSFEQIASSIEKCAGVGRRFQLLYTQNDFEIIDDYAHHPTEIASTLQILRSTRGNKKLIAIFEPHRFTRTKDCWEAFFHCFNEIDQLYLGPIYAASESSIPGITASRLAQDINRIHPGLVCSLESMDEMKEVIREFASKNATVITLGAGSIGKRIRDIVEEIS